MKPSSGARCGVERLRLCVACRELKPRSALHRVTWSAAGECFSVDDQPRLQGRSCYVCRCPACLQSALKARKLQKSLKRAIPDDILGYLNNALEGLKREWPPQK